MANPIALITGANRGLGAETGRLLAQRGYHVALAARDFAKVEAIASSLRNEGLEATPVKMDVTHPAEIQRAAKLVADRHGALDVLVNNAAVFLDDAGASDILGASTEMIAKTMEVNFFGALRVCRAFMPAMMARKAGCVVNVSSGMGQSDSMTSDSVGYRLSKSALNSLTLMLADHARGSGVLVNAVCPGWVRTDMGGPNATRSLEEGAASIVWAATLEPGGPSGGFFRDGNRLDW